MYRLFHPPHIYRCNAVYFITASTFNNEPVLAMDTHKRLFRDLLKEAVQQHPIRLYAWAVLRDHYHLLLLVKEGGDIGRFIRSVNGSTSRRLNQLDGCQGRRVWRNYWDRFPRDEGDFWRFFNYIHIQPIKHSEVALAGREAGGFPIEAGLPVLLDYGLDIHTVLRRYEFSSYPFYLRRYGEEWLTDIWTRYPVSDHLMAWDEKAQFPGVLQRQVE